MLVNDPIPGERGVVDRHIHVNGDLVHAFIEDEALNVLVQAGFSGVLVDEEGEIGVADKGDTLVDPVEGLKSDDANCGRVV